MIGEPRTATHDENGSVSLQQLQILMVILAVTISATLMGFTFVASRSSPRLTKATDEYTTRPPTTHSPRRTTATATSCCCPAST